MLPLHAHGYRSGFSASPGFRQIRHTSSSSSSSSSNFAGAVDTVAGAVDSISFPWEPRGDDAEEEAEEEVGEEEEDDGELTKASEVVGAAERGVPSWEDGGSWAISMGIGLDRTGQGPSRWRVRASQGRKERMRGNEERERVEDG